MFLLKIQWQLYGLKAPAFSWIVSICLIVYSIYIYGRHLKASRNRQRVLFVAEKRLSSLGSEAPGQPGEGISRSFYDSIASVFDDLPLLQPIWRAVASCVLVTDRDKEGRFWVSEDIDQIVTNTKVIDHDGYKTAPTVISGVGLLATFLAILVALLDVRLAQNRVQGLDLLVQGLSGKFLSSVAALGCATLLVQAEKGLYRPVVSGMARLSVALRGVLPRLLQAQIMSDLRTDMAVQAKMFGAFDVDLKGAVKEGLSENLRSAVEALGKMASLQEELNRFVRENEAQKQQAMTDQLKAALQDFGQSLGASLERMANKFDEALALNTHGHFVQISESLSSAATLLQQVNEQLGRNQYVLIDLVDLARATTKTETEARKAQTEHLTSTIGEMMTRLQEKMAETMTSIDTTMAAVTGNLSDKVTEVSTEMATVIRETSERSTNKAKEVMESISAKVEELSTEMATVIRETSERSTNKAKEVIDRASTVSSRSATHLADLLGRHASELTRVEELRDMLDGSIKSFIGSIEKHTRLTDGLQQATAQVNVGVASLGQTAKSIKESQESAARISASVSAQVELMKGVIQNHGEMWDRIKLSMVEYEKIFGAVEGQAGEMLGQIAHHLQAYSGATEKHFSNLALTADTLVSQATGRLSGSIKELSEQLDDLQVALGCLGRVSQVGN
jgi:ABC-type transporter Mla subunit MlaD